MKVTDEMIKRAGKVSIDGGNTWVEATDIAEWLADDDNWALIEPACKANERLYDEWNKEFFVDWTPSEDEPRARRVELLAHEYDVWGLIIK